MANEKDVTEKKTVSDVISNFLTKYGKIFVIIILVLIFAAVALGIVNVFTNKAAIKNFDALDEITYAFTTARESLSGDELAEKETELVEKAILLAEANKGKAVGARAYMFAADVEFQKKNYEAAKSAWINAAESSKKSYVSALSYYNAAVACEELADNESAIKYYGLAIENPDFALKSKAMFNLGRVQESVEAYADAIATYNKLCDENPDDSYAQLAKSRVIALQAGGKAE